MLKAVVVLCDLCVFAAWRAAFDVVFADYFKRMAWPG
jgi:hypothetical protein